jgi:hypothetical protein
LVKDLNEPTWQSGATRLPMSERSDTAPQHLTDRPAER